MSESYDETIGGKTIWRSAPGPRHELICSRLHKNVFAAAANLASTRLLVRRSPVTLNARTTLRPDLALLAVATQKLWLAAEVVNTEDHSADTVTKKQAYEEAKVPRVWIIDPRYDNVEVYHGSEHGLVLKGILAGRDVLTEKLLPEFHLTIVDLFAAEAPAA